MPLITSSSYGSDISILIRLRAIDRNQSESAAFDARADARLDQNVQVLWCKFRAVSSMTIVFAGSACMFFERTLRTIVMVSLL